MIRGLPLLLLPMVLGVGACAESPPQGGIVSTNPCADAILARVAPDELAAVSHYSHDPAATSMPLSLARRWPSIAGTAEEVIARHPDLVVTDSFAPAATRAAYARAGLRVLTLGSVATIADSEHQVMEIARAAGRPAAGEALVAEIERAVSRYAPPRRRPGSSSDGVGNGTQRQPIPAHQLDPGPGSYRRITSRGGLRRGGEKKQPPSALLYISGDLANGSGTLLDDLLTHAGFRNAAADYGLTFTGTLSIETIAAQPPAIILSPGDGRTAHLRRRVLAPEGAATREAEFPRRLMNCGGPVIPAALARLAAIRRGL